MIFNTMLSVPTRGSRSSWSSTTAQLGHLLVGTYSLTSFHILIHLWWKGVCIHFELVITKQRFLCVPIYDVSYGLWKGRPARRVGDRLGAIACACDGTSVCIVMNFAIHHIPLSIYNCCPLPLHIVSSLVGFSWRRVALPDIH